MTTVRSSVIGAECWEISEKTRLRRGKREKRHTSDGEQKERSEQEAIVL
jgi:hypothetical protein